MNPYLAKLHSLNSGKTVPQATDETDKTCGDIGYVGFVGAEGCGVTKIDGSVGAEPDTPPYSENIVPLSTKEATAQPWSDAEEERAAIIEYDGGAPRAWAEALARLDPNKPPGDVPPKRWLKFVDDCGKFIDDGWATSAERLGWGPLDLFGCDRTKPLARINRAGLLWLLNGRKLLVLSADAAAIATASGGYLTSRPRISDLGGVLAWELPAASTRLPIESHD